MFWARTDKISLQPKDTKRRGWGFCTFKLVLVNSPLLSDPLRVEGTMFGFVRLRSLIFYDIGSVDLGILLCFHQNVCTHCFRSFERNSLWIDLCQWEVIWGLTKIWLPDYTFYKTEICRSRWLDRARKVRCEHHSYWQIQTWSDIWLELRSRKNIDIKWTLKKAQIMFFFVVEQKGPDWFEIWLFTFPLSCISNFFM